MNKKGIEHSLTMLAALLAGAIMIVSVVYVSFKANPFGEDKCDLQNFHFLSGLQSKISVLSQAGGGSIERGGSRENAEFKIPCGEKAYFIDPGKKQELLDSGTLKDEPLLLDAVRSNTNKSLYITKGGAIIGSYNIGKISADYPYNICLDLKAKKTINMEIEDRGSQVKLIPHCQQLECTQVPEELQETDLKKLAYTVCGGTNPDCDGGTDDEWKACAPTTAELGQCYDAELQNLENAIGNLEVKLKVSSCFPEKTKVEFIIKPKTADIAAKGVKFFETVPKECITHLGEDIKVEGGEGNVLINPDPMIVWTFPTVSEETRVSYEIPKILSDDCRKQLKAAPAAEFIVKKASAGTSIDMITDRDIAPITRDEQRQITRVVQRRQHHQRLMEDTAPAFAPETSTGFARLEQGQRGQRVRLRDNGRFEERGENTEPVISRFFEEGVSPLDAGETGQNLLKPTTVSLCDRPPTGDSEPSYVFDAETSCQDLVKSIESDNSDVNCRVENNRIICDVGDTDADSVTLTLTVTDSEEATVRQEFVVGII